MHMRTRERILKSIAESRRDSAQLKVDAIRARVETARESTVKIVKEAETAKRGVVDAKKRIHDMTEDFKLK